MTMRADEQVPSGRRCSAFAASALMPSAGMPEPPSRPLDPETGPTPSSGCAIRNPAAPISCAHLSLTRRCTCPGVNGYSWRTMTIRPGLLRVTLEVLKMARAEIAHSGCGPRRRCRAQERRAGEGSAALRIDQFRFAAPPTAIVHLFLADHCARHGSELRARKGDRRG